MKTFDQALFELYETGFISYEDALRNADSKNELRLRIKLESKREAKNIDDGGALQDRRRRGGPQPVKSAKRADRDRRRGRSSPRARSARHRRGCRGGGDRARTRRSTPSRCSS